MPFGKSLSEFSVRSGLCTESCICVPDDPQHGVVQLLMPFYLTPEGEKASPFLKNLFSLSRSPAPSREMSHDPKPGAGLWGGPGTLSAAGAGTMSAAGSWLPTSLRRALFLRGSHWPCKAFLQELLWPHSSLDHLAAGTVCDLLPLPGRGRGKKPEPVLPS